MLHKSLTSILFFTIILSGPLSGATLGEGGSSVEKDRQLLNGTRTSTPSTLFTVHEIVEGKTVIKEFESPAGIIFGISWKGPVHPDLAILLGSYHADYATTSNQLKQKGHQPEVFSTSHLHLERQGHMRGIMKGRAFDPTLIPDGLTSEVVQ